METPLPRAVIAHTAGGGCAGDVACSQILDTGYWILSLAMPHASLKPKIEVFAGSPSAQNVHENSLRQHENFRQDVSRRRSLLFWTAKLAEAKRR